MDPALRQEAEAAVSACVVSLLAKAAEKADGASAAMADQWVREMVLAGGRRGLERSLEADRSDCGTANAPRCGHCGGRMRYLGRERAPTETAVGTVRVAMGRHVCAACGRSARPRAARLVGEDVEARRTELLSSAISVVGRAGAANDASFDRAPARRPLKEGRVLCVALDGTGVPARPSETAGRRGKDGGRATTREAKVGVVWLIEPDGEGGMRNVPGAAWHFAAIESAEDDGRGDSPTARRLLRELAALGFAPADVGVALGDGAEWLRRLYAQWFPDAVRIVDFFHAAEYLWAAARARHHRDEGAAKRWEKLCGLLDYLGRPPAPSGVTRIGRVCQRSVVHP